LDSSKGETVVEAQHGNSLEPVVHGPGGKDTTMGFEASAKTPVSLKGEGRSYKNLKRK
jgi:hypothetical protein